MLMLPERDRIANPSIRGCGEADIIIHDEARRPARPIETNDDDDENLFCSHLANFSLARGVR